MVLPTQRTAPITDVSAQTVLVYGRPKIGKTTFCSKAPGALFLATEPGLKSQSVFALTINSWEDMLEAAALVAKGDHEFKTVVIDTIDNAYQFCADFICRKFAVKHQSDLEYGKGSSLVNQELQRVMTKLASLPYGLVMTSHAIDRDVETPTGKYKKITPTLPEGVRKIILGFVDIILFADIEAHADGDGKLVQMRVLRASQSKFHEAGDRTGRLPEMFPLDFGAFVAAMGAPKRGDLAGETATTKITTGGQAPGQAGADATKVVKTIGEDGAQTLIGLCAKAGKDPASILAAVQKRHPDVLRMSDTPQPRFAGIVRQLNEVIAARVAAAENEAAKAAGEAAPVTEPAATA